MKLRLSRGVLLLGSLALLGYAAASIGQVKPRAGRWAGDPSVSFTVKPDGTIIGFKISVPLAMGSCALQFAKMPLTKSGDLLLEGAGGAFSVKGRFRSADLVEGKVAIKYCPDPEDKNNAVMLVPWVKDWSARAR